MQTETTEPTAPFPIEPIPPELLALARRMFAGQDALKELRDLKATGGHSFESFIAEVEAEALKP